MFVDLLLVEGIARYSEKQTEYPFDIQFIKKQYSQLVTLVDTIQDYFKLLRVISKEYSEILIGNKSNSQLPELTEKQIQEFEEDSEEMFANIKAYVYHIGPHMIHVTLFGNDDLSIPQLMRLNRFEFITAYEKGCSHIGIKPLVSLTSGNGIFDYKQALQRLHKAAKYMEKL